MRTLREISNFKNKKVLLRADFDVPVSSDGIIQEIFRIKKQKPMIDYLVSRGAITVMVAHISDEDVVSFDDIIPQLQKILNHEIKYFDALDNLEGLKKLQPGFVGILHKIRDYEGEVKNDKEFAKKLAEGFSLYINNDFAVSHRNHASVSGITKFLTSYAGLLIEEETSQLQKVINVPKEGKILIMGGAKASTKIKVIKNLIDKAEVVLIGGVIANDVLKARGQDIGQSKVDENTTELFAGLNLSDSRLIMPEDYLWDENKILDVGEKTINNFTERISNAKMIIWNGPMGMFEDSRFANGTNKIAQAIAESSAIKIIGGGDTISAVSKVNLMDNFDFVSTGGGAMLSFLAGDKLPGLEALGYYD